MKRIIEDTTATILMTILAFGFIIGLSAYSMNECSKKNDNTKDKIHCIGL